MTGGPASPAPGAGRVRLGVVGAGQLGRMLHQAGISLGCDLRIMADRPDDAAAQVAGEVRLGSAMSVRDLADFAGECDVVTFEHEVVDLEGLTALEAAGVATFRPSSQALRAVADRIGMRRAVETAGLPVPPWCSARSVAEVEEATARWPAAVLKMNRGGYDGRGVFMVDGESQGREVAARLLTGGAALIVEPRLDFEMEVAVVVARRPGGACVVYDPVATLQVDGQCRQVTMPAGLPTGLSAEAAHIAQHVANALEVVGLVAVELFVVGGHLVVNELAVRPHNTGHHTIDACQTSQFENHLRAVLDLPLGSTAPTTPAAAMVNVIGDRRDVDPRDRLAGALAGDPDAHVHLYGKEVRADRKIGHVTVCDETSAGAARRAWAVVEALGGVVPGEVRDRFTEETT